MSAPIVILLVALTAIAAVGVWFYLRARPVEQEPLYYMQCFNCKRKLRYRRQQAGRKGACPRCRHSFLFPEVPANTSAKH